MCASFYHRLATALVTRLKTLRLIYRVGEALPWLRHSRSAALWLLHIKNRLAGEGGVIARYPAIHQDRRIF